MTALIVSPSAVLRSTLKQVLLGVRGTGAVWEIGSFLPLPRLIEERRPDVVFWDESLGTIPDFMALKPSATFRFHLIRLVSSGSADVRGGTSSTMVKPDYSTGAAEDYAQAQIPVLNELFHDLEAQKSKSDDAVSSLSGGPVQLIVLGASTGGPSAIKAILQALPADFPVPLAVVQHIDAGYEAGYASWLAENTRLKVRLAADNDAPGPGEVIVAPTDVHLICRNGRFFLDGGPKIFSQRPSIDRLFSTAAPVFARNLVGILLTGIGSDGARGCRDILDHGGVTLVQDEATSTVWGMPKAAVDLKAASRVLPLDRIGPQLLELIEQRAGQ